MAPPEESVKRYPSGSLARLPLMIAAVGKGTVLADQIFPPGATVSVGSNSGNSLVIPERYELTTYTLVTHGHVLKLLPPLHVQAWVWVGNEARELKGHFRDLRKKFPELPDDLPLAGDRFVVSYASGIAFMGRFLEN
jgi:hypothetical protein